MTAQDPDASKALNSKSALAAATDRFGDRTLASLIGLVLFALVAWPLLVSEAPPFQDLPNHLATATVMLNPSRYPEFVSNGLLKTNAALFAWLFLVGGSVGVVFAAKLFTWVTLAAMAFAIPHFVLTFRNRNAMVVASLFAWPMVHNWWVSMGMLDFALAVALSLAVLIGLERRRKQATLSNFLLVALASVATWYAHVFPLLVVLPLGIGA